MSLPRTVAGNPYFYRLMLRWHRLVPPIERLLRLLSRGRVGVLEVVGVPSLQLTVAGRKSGIPRTVIVQYVPDGQAMLLVGSNWGLPTHPDWARNLRATDRACVSRNGCCETVTVEHLTGAERQRAWTATLDFWPNYALAQERAVARPFWLVALRPTSD
ncbi:nitroreductase family deazaflavin-dependent oxidoreductase [Mycobacterium sp. LTG2003]